MFMWIPLFCEFGGLTTDSDVDCCCVRTVLGSFLPSQRSCSRSFSNRTCVADGHHSQPAGSHGRPALGRGPNLAKLHTAGHQKALPRGLVGFLLQLFQFLLETRHKEMSRREG